MFLVFVDIIFFTHISLGETISLKETKAQKCRWKMWTKTLKHCTRSVIQKCICRYSEFDALRDRQAIYIYIYSFFIHVLKFGLAVRNLYLGIFLEIQKQLIFFHREEVRAIYYITNIMKISLKPHGLFYPNLLIKAFIRTLNNADCLMVCVIWTTGIIKITYM